MSQLRALHETYFAWGHTQDFLVLRSFSFLLTLKENPIKWKSVAIPTDGITFCGLKRLEWPSAVVPNGLSQIVVNICGKMQKLGVRDGRTGIA